jgi:glucose/arabinose dehydrogenase
MLPVCIALLALAVPGAPAAGPPLATELLADGFTKPLSLSHAPGDPDRLFVVEKAGLIKIVALATGQVNPKPFLDISTLVVAAGDRGLLGLAFDPDYATTGYAYVYYIAKGTDDGTLVRYTVSADPDVLDPASAHLVLSYDRPFGHNGGWLGFAPDGTLFLSSGDGSTPDNPDPGNLAQRTDNFMGKLLRLDPSGDDFPGDPNRNYAVPADNPFVGTAGEDEIWAYGLRNPWRCAFDSATGDLWIADVGAAQAEEINVEFAPAQGGRNYGWRCAEGLFCTGLGGCDCDDPSLVPPLYAYGHDDGDCSITGGYVYRGSAIQGLQGAYFFGDFCTGRVWTLTLDGHSPGEVADRTAELAPPDGLDLGSIASFGEDAAGEIYVCDHADGEVFRIVRGCTADCDNSGVLDLFDFLCFTNAFNAQQPYADCDRNAALDLFDFLCFVNQFNTGC